MRFRLSSIWYSVKGIEKGWDYEKRIRPGTVLYWSAAIIWFLAAAFPLYFTFISSFKDNSQIFSAFLIPSLRPVFDNYVMAQKMAGILKATANSLFVSGSAIAIMLLFCTMAAYVTARKRVPFASAVSGLLIAALMIPIQSAIVPIVQMVSSLGLKNRLWTLTIIYAGLNMALVFFIMKIILRESPRTWMRLQ